jgi:hypothetical protein
MEQQELFWFSYSLLNRDGQLSLRNVYYLKYFKMKRNIWFWLAAVLITFAAVIFQRKTGPTYPKRVNIEIDTVSLSMKLPRSHEIDSVLTVTIPGLSWEWTARLFHRPYPTDADWSVDPFFPEGDEFIAYFPNISQKAAKLEYYIELSNLAEGKEISIPDDEPIVIRFKGKVPGWALLPHVLLMFIALIISNLTGILAVSNHDKYRFYGKLTLILILVGGLIFGPIVQKFAFDHYWTGFPFGSDLTDNKTLIMFVFWAIAVALNYRKGMRWFTIVAALVTIIVYCIPHSLRGSEFDYQAGEIVTGMVYSLKVWLL